MGVEERTREVKLHASKALSISNHIDEANHVEIVELTGGRIIKGSIPGNYVPSLSSSMEGDTSRAELTIVPPTGSKVNYTLYIIAGIITFAILVSGIVVIKKKIIK